MAEDGFDDAVTILVTGFGEFKTFKVNPSWEIVSRLPSTLSDKGINVRIVLQQGPVKVAYHDVLDVVPELIDQTKPDAIIHVGLAAERDYFAIERGSDRDGYHQYPDVAGKVFTKTESKALWGKSPERLNSSLNLEDVHKKWTIALGKKSNIDVRTSDDVGSYVCGFIYYTSMQHLWKKDTSTPVLFFHVPKLPTPKDIEAGVNALRALLLAVAQSCEK